MPRAPGTGRRSSGEYRWDLLSIIDKDLDWSHVVPRVAGPTEVVGEWNGAKVACGTGDNMAAALGLGLQPGVAVLSLGTSGTAYAVSDHPTADASGAVAGFADASGALPAVGLHTQRHQGDRCDRPAARRRSRRVRPAGAGRACRAPAG